MIIYKRNILKWNIYYISQLHLLKDVIILARITKLNLTSLNFLLYSLARIYFWNIISWRRPWLKFRVYKIWFLMSLYFHIGCWKWDQCHIMSWLTDKKPSQLTNALLEISLYLSWEIVKWRVKTKRSTLFYKISIALNRLFLPYSLFLFCWKCNISNKPPVLFSLGKI